MSLFDEVNFCEVTSPGYPGERLVCCKDPLLAKERGRKREALLASAEAELEAAGPPPGLVPVHGAFWQ